MSLKFPRVPLRYQLLLMLFLILVISAGIFTYQQSQTTIKVDVNGTVYTIETSATTVGGALREADIYLDDADRVQPELETPVTADMTITIQRAHQLVLDIGGNIQRIYTHANSPNAILAEQAIELNPTDQLFVNYLPHSATTTLDDITQLRHLRIVRGKSFTITIDGTVAATGNSTAQTVGELLAEQNIDLYLADRIEPPPLAFLRHDQTISVNRSAPVQIEVDGRVLNTRAVGHTINTVLTAIGLPLSGQDYTIPDASTPFESGMTIRIIRVLEQVERQQEPIPFDTITIPDPTLPTGTTTVVQQGKPGLRETALRIRQEDGYVVSRRTQVPWVIVPPINEIIAYGVGEE
jgi:resuscitation-promoting factor RpfB